jgi:hypothetical protein
MGSTLELWIIIRGEDAFLWLLMGDLKAVTESEVIAAQDLHYKQNIVQQRYYKQKQIANADCVNNLTRH